MPWTARSLACALALGVALLAASPAAALAAGRPALLRPQLVGENIPSPVDYGSTQQIAETIAQARALHATAVRAAVPWSLLEPAGPGQFDPQRLAYTDALVADAAAAGIRVIATAFSTPCWASSAPASLLSQCTPGHLSAANAWPPRNPAEYAAFAAFLAARYGTRLAAIEIWNEPDQSNQLYFAGPYKVTRYASILRAAYPAIKRANPHVTVIAGSLVGSNGAFLRALYAAGIKGFYDGLAVHYYNLVLGSVRAIHEVQRASGDSKPLWLDEFGWTSCYPAHEIEEEQACVTESTQAANLADVFHELSRTSYVAAVVAYNLKDSPTGQFGVLNALGERKPAFSALAGALASPGGPPTATRLTLHAHGARVVASGSGPVGDYMQLEAFAHGGLRYTTLFTLDRFNRYAITLPASLGTHGLRVRVYQYWRGPASAAQGTI